MEQALHVVTNSMKRTVLLLFIVLFIAPASNQHPIRSAEYDAYELIYVTDVTTELTGSIRMFCRSSTTAEDVAISDVRFWLNSTACNSTTSLRERKDVNVSEVDNYSIKFNVTRSLEGYYTCGKQVDENCVMSTELALICKYGYTACISFIYSLLRRKRACGNFTCINIPRYTQK